MEIKFDLGTLLLLAFLLLYLIAIIVFPLSKRNDIFGLKHEKCFESEEIWHRIHVNACIGTIPFAIIDFAMCFVGNVIVKILVTFIILVLVITMWDLVAKYTYRYIKKNNDIQEENKDNK